MKILAVLTLIFSTLLAAAEYDVTVELALNSDQSPAQLDQQLRELAAQRALHQAAKYIEATQQLRDDEYSEVIRSLSAGLVTFESETFSWTTSPEGLPIRRLAVVIHVDQEPFIAQIEASKVNRDMAALNVALSRVIERQQQQLTEMQRTNGQSVPQDNSERALVTRARRLQDLMQRNYTLSEADRRTLLKMTRLNQQVEQPSSTAQSVSKAAQVIARLYQYIEDGVVMADPAVAFEPLPDDGFEAVVYVDYHLDTLPVTGLLEEWFSAKSEHECIRYHLNPSLSIDAEKTAKLIQKNLPEIFIAGRYGSKVKSQAISVPSEDGWLLCSQPQLDTVRYGMAEYIAFNFTPTSSEARSTNIQLDVWLDGAATAHY
ncbi:hypothetical protein K0504_10165 [Neiella marina]|uniref:Uncharacterized protein n=1 Tax=Neiella holothuriorum TaxID=2870530 RepID=A0ABS7EGD3_9GAMM|nr:hypothetical protein [Neiella holothuriorum]MBW8191403.1 hypothetical protein [Neiella holothuriorum]